MPARPNGPATEGQAVEVLWFEPLEVGVLVGGGGVRRWLERTGGVLEIHRTHACLALRPGQGAGDGTVQVVLAVLVVVRTCQALRREGFRA